MRSDEVAHHAKVQSPEKGENRNSRYGRVRYKDIHLTEGDLSMSGTLEEVSRGHSSCGKRAGIANTIPLRSHRAAKDRTLNCVLIWLGTPIAIGVALP